jgi:hypothetical protein
VIDKIDGWAIAVGVIAVLFILLGGVVGAVEHHPIVMAWLFGAALIGFPLVWAALRFTVLK